MADEVKPTKDKEEVTEEIVEEAKEASTSEAAGAPTESVGQETVEVPVESSPVEQKVQDVPVEEVTDEETKEEQAEETKGVADLDNPKKSIKQAGQQGWYVIHTYSGYEDQVADSLKQRIESMGMKDFIYSVIVPTEKQIEIKNGKRSVVEKKIFPGYVLVEMNVTDESWYVVRNTPNVTGFVGFGVRPTPMSEPEIARIKKRMSVQEPKHKIEFKIDDLVRINDGPLKGFEGKVTDIDEGKGKIKVSVNMFGRETPANIDFLQAKKV